MAYRVRRLTDAILYAFVTQHNLKQEAAVASFFHSDITQTTNSSDYRNPSVTNLLVTAANATDLPTSLTLANQLQAYLNVHWQDAYAHKTAVSPKDTTAKAIDLATGITLANALKAAINVHLTASNVHWTNDGTNTVATTNASDQTSLNALLNALKTAYNAHVISAPTGSMIQIVEA